MSFARCVTSGEGAAFLASSPDGTSLGLFRMFFLPIPRTDQCDPSQFSAFLPTNCPISTEGEEVRIQYIRANLIFPDPNNQLDFGLMLTNHDGQIVPQLIPNFQTDANGYYADVDVQEQVRGIILQIVLPNGGNEYEVTHFKFRDDYVGYVLSHETIADTFESIATKNAQAVSGYAVTSVDSSHCNSCLLAGQCPPQTFRRS